MRFGGWLVAALGLAISSLASAQAPAPVAPAADPQNILNLDLSTGGRVQILLRPDKAPLAVERIKTLVGRGFYDGLSFHRVIDGFMAQGGDPKGTGEGGSDLPDLKAEFNDMPHVRGVMAMARAQADDSANSQFFIMLAPNFRLDGKYTAIGRVISGMQYVDAIEKGEPPANPSKIVHASMGAQGPVTAAAPAAAPAAIATTPLPPSEAEPDATEAAVRQVLRNGVEKDEKKR
jgi:cyclophilin family peptidyl-prolyl cis-trans isomerase